MLLLIVVIEQKYSESPAREVDIMAMIMIMRLKYLSSYILLLRNGFCSLKVDFKIVKQETRRRSV